jgi:hypothetical protein
MALLFFYIIFMLSPLLSPFNLETPLQTLNTLDTFL